ncbi:MAG: hypothetical protein P9L93_05910 [Candidatus Gorgyraea atricola]|nr:hypothetical protein [Candidatus Gorgyraea atricola]
MKKIIIISFFIIFSASFALAATVGGPDMSVPEDSLFLKEQAIKKTLDKFEEEMNIKVGLDMEIVTKRTLSSATDVTDAEMDGYNFILKVSNNYKDMLDSYIKIGTSSLEVEWEQNGDAVKVESNIGLSWGAGLKAKLWELKNYDVDLTMDLQYRHSDLGFDKAKINGSESTASRTNEDFTIDEWQTSLLASKKFIIPLGVNDCYVIPYGGLTYLASDIDVNFMRSTTGQLYSTYNANDENSFGIVLGCDIMPFYLSYYLLNFELRLLNETALTLGGTVKF